MVLPQGRKPGQCLHTLPDLPEGLAYELEERLDLLRTGCVHFRDKIHGYNCDIDIIDDKLRDINDVEVKDQLKSNRAKLVNKKRQVELALCTYQQEIRLIQDILDRYGDMSASLYGAVKGYPHS